MSRTDKTKPWWVRVRDHHPQVVHNHVDGACDLPDDFREALNNFRGCHIRDWKLTYPGNCCWGCGCDLCTDQEGRKAKRRKERRETKVRLRKTVW